MALLEASRVQPAVGLQFHPEYTREMVAYYADANRQLWKADKFVSPAEEILTRTEKVQDTYWLMEILSNNMVEELEIA